MSEQRIAECLLQYQQSADRTSETDPNVANEFQKQMHACYKWLRESEAGRQGITALIDDPSPSVRCWAAAHSLTWALEKARAALISLRNGKDPCSFDAEMTLNEFDKGTLSFEY